MWNKRQILYFICSSKYSELVCEIRQICIIVTEYCNICNNNNSLIYYSKQIISYIVNKLTVESEKYYQYSITIKKFSSWYFREHNILTDKQVVNLQYLHFANCTIKLKFNEYSIYSMQLNLYRVIQKVVHKLKNHIVWSIYIGLYIFFFEQEPWSPKQFSVVIIP